MGWLKEVLCVALHSNTVLTTLSFFFSPSRVQSPLSCPAFSDLVWCYFPSALSNVPHCLFLICFLFLSCTSGTLSISLAFTPPHLPYHSLFLLLSLSVTKTSAFRAPNSFCRLPPHLSSSSRAASRSSWRPPQKMGEHYPAVPPSTWVAHAPHFPSASPPLQRPPPASVARSPPTCCRSMDTATHTTTAMPSRSQ